MLYRHRLGNNFLDQVDVRRALARGILAFAVGWYCIHAWSGAFQGRKARQIFSLDLSSVRARWQYTAYLVHSFLCAVKKRIFVSVFLSEK